MAVFIACAVLTVSCLWFGRAVNRRLEKLVSGLAELNARERDAFTNALLREVHEREILERLLAELVALRDDIRRPNHRELAGGVHITGVEGSVNGSESRARSWGAAG